MNRIGQKAVDVYEMLRAAKKVTTIGDYDIKYKEDWNDPNLGTYTSDKTRLTPILYFWCNPQMNRIIGKLADGRERDIELGLLDLHSYNFMEYIEEPKPDGWRDIFDGKKLGSCTWHTATSKAKELNYPYICWNGKIYATRDTYQAFPICLEEEL
jgi:hypothetical protein